MPERCNTLEEACRKGEHLIRRALRGAQRARTEGSNTVHHAGVRGSMTEAEIAEAEVEIAALDRIIVFASHALSHLPPEGDGTRLVAVQAALETLEVLSR
jgi:hypothetical protein